MPQQMIADAHRRGRFEVKSLGIEIANGDLGPTLETAIEALHAIRMAYTQGEIREIAIAALILLDPANADLYARGAGLEMDA